MTANLTGELRCVTPVAERNVPENVPLATTPAAVARKLVIFAVNDNLDDPRGLALATGAAAAANANTKKTATTSLRIVSSLSG